MGNPAYDARRAAEQAEAEKRQAEAESGKAAHETLTDLLRGAASIQVSNMVPGIGMTIRLVRDRK